MERVGGVGGAMSCANARRVIAGAVLVTVSLGIWIIVIERSAGIQTALPSIARSLSAGLFLVAGAARLAWSRLTGDDWGLHRAHALLVIGVTLPVATGVDAALRNGHVQPLGMPSRLIMLVPALSVIAFGALVGHRFSTRQIAKATACIALGTVALTAVVLLGTRSDSLGSAWMYVEAAAAVGWTATAVHIWRYHRDGPESVALIPAVLMMAGCEAIKAASVAQPGNLAAIASGFQLAAGGLALLAATSDTVGVFRTRSRDARELTRTLCETQRYLAQYEQRERERLHDARSAVVGVLGASRLLAEATPVDPQTLRQLMDAELQRLRTVLDDDEPIQQFAVADALRPVVLAHQLDGMPVRAEFGNALAIGRPRALATALDNLLNNARMHAPGAAVDVRAFTVGDTIAIAVDDDGPGIPAAERTRVLDAGVRGSTARGNGRGLGLHSVASAMANQGGSVHLTDRPGGTRALLTVPAASIDSVAG